MKTDSESDRSLPSELPVIALRELVVFPHMALPLIVAREKSVAAVESSLGGDRLVLLVTQRDADVSEPECSDLYQVGTVALLTNQSRTNDGRLKVLVQGFAKARIESVVSDEEEIRVRISELPAEEGDEWTVEGEALVRAVRGRAEQLLPLRDLPPEILSVTSNVDLPGRLADLLAANLRLRVSEAQEILEISDPLARLRRADVLIRRELEVSSVQAEIQTQAREEMSRGQREAFLREQIRAIQNELGEVDAAPSEIDEYQTKIENANLPAECFEESARQLQRLGSMHPDGPEAQVVRNYLDWIVDLPWNRCSPDRLELDEAREVLDADHAHLEPIKERILEFLSVRKLREDSRGPILCFSGPPGVGKTSLGRSIARAMGREFVRISLGGVRDEAEVRGHRRTYVGAMPGRIIQAMKRAGTSNPVIMLDEIDKLCSDYKGDPGSALLEVLDPEQNHAFSDHFLNVPFDLSRVLFIATANQIERIPRPLLDRMETVRLSGYTQEEKSEIASRFLIPRQVTENGLPSAQINWSRGCVEQLISGYTREPGVRDLERQIGKVCRKIARRLAEGDQSKVTVSQRNISRFLGVASFDRPPHSIVDEVGCAKGLAWTEAGGELLAVEATLTPGRGLMLTGQLGDVMKESGQTAFSLARSLLRCAGQNQDELAMSQVHVHVPNGATPKDGPSAGVTIATTIISLVTGIPVRGDLAMTGEVTLRGKVLPVGGVREKALAALRMGIKTVVVPRQSMREVEEIPRELRRKLEFIPVEEMADILDIALTEKRDWRERTFAPSSSPTTAMQASFRPDR
jgi:ATP-dependent Lon protease